MNDLIPCLPDEIARECLIRVPYKQFSTASAVCKGWKEEIESAQFHWQRSAGGLSRHVVVLTQAEPTGASCVGKFPATPAYGLTLYEPVTGAWDRLSPPPENSDGLPLFCQLAGVGRNLVVIGGWNPMTWEVSKAVFVYDFVSATWHRGADMPGVSRSFFSCATDSDRTVFVAGGHDEEKNALRSAMAFDVVRDEWVLLPDMARHRDECRGIFHAGKFHVIGGYCTDIQGRFDGSAEAFDVATGQWDQVQEDILVTGTCPRTCVVGAKGKFYRCLSSQVAVLEGRKWQVVAELPLDVRVAPYIVTYQEKLLVFGSALYGGPHVAYVLDVQSNTWTKVEALDRCLGHVQTMCCLEI